MQVHHMVPLVHPSKPAGPDDGFCFRTSVVAEEHDGVPVRNLIRVAAEDDVIVIEAV